MIQNICFQAHQKAFWTELAKLCFNELIGSQFQTWAYTPLKILGWNLKITGHWKGTCFLQPPFLGFHVNFLGCKSFSIMIIHQRLYVKYFHPYIPSLELGKPNKCDCFEWIWTWSRGSGGKCGTSEGEDVWVHTNPPNQQKCRFRLGCSTKKMINIVVVTGILRHPEWGGG